jgi:ribosomal protein L35AE/L33A
MVPRIFPNYREDKKMKLQFIEAGEIVTTHGVRGEVKVMPWLDSVEDLCDFDRCRIDGNHFAIEACRVQKTCNLVKRSGVDTMEDAQKMRGKTVFELRLDSLGALCQCVLINTTLKTKLVFVLFSKLYDIISANGLYRMHAIDAAFNKIVKYG